MHLSPTTKYAALDLGSNSFHLLVAEYKNNQLEITHRLGRKIQLAAGLDSNNYLDKAAQKRGLNCIKKFSDFLDNINPQHLGIVATSTLRKATNAQDFLTQAENLLNHKIKVISGEEEAELVYQGAVLYTPPVSKQRLVVDIGGGSTEFILGEGTSPLILRSLDMGCVSVTNKFFPENITPCETIYEQAYQYVSQQLEPIKTELLEQKWHRVDGCSGTFKTLAEIELPTFSTSQLSLRKLAKLKEMWLAGTSDETWESLGVRPERTHLIPAGLALCTAIFHQLNIDTLNYADGALREGLLQQILEGKNPSCE